ncbi:MAG TPA: hypothetical protein VMR23_09325, partial [Candidatus Limnocylindria bacterium]|nr:hypothetical protein [Candidatus Limnocylindria bacterium]
MGGIFAISSDFIVISHSPGFICSAARAVTAARSIGHSTSAIVSVRMNSPIDAIQTRSPLYDCSTPVLTQTDAG